MAMTESGKIRVVFLGTPAFALPALEALHAAPGIELLAVVTQPDRPAGRGQKLMPPPVRTLAESLGLPLYQTPSIKKDQELKDRLRALQADFHVTVAFGQILTQEVLDIPRLGTVNAHASLLPELRGPNPIQQAILQGKAETGITTMLTELGVDTGPMLLKHAVTIGPDETMGELTRRLAEASGPLLVETLTRLAAGNLTPQVQDDALATHAPKCDKDQALLDWTEPAALLHRKIRAFNPAPGAATFWQGERIKLLTSHLPGKAEDFLKPAGPGEILAIIESGIRVQTGDGVLEIRTLQPAGKREMPARAWAAGALGKPRADLPLGCFEKAQTASQPV